jgi:hypothetical protein
MGLAVLFGEVEGAEPEGIRCEDQRRVSVVVREQGELAPRRRPARRWAGAAKSEVRPGHRPRRRPSLSALARCSAARRTLQLPAQGPALATTRSGAAEALVLGSAVEVPPRSTRDGRAHHRYEPGCLVEVLQPACDDGRNRSTNGTPLMSAGLSVVPKGEGTPGDASWRWIARRFGKLKGA